MVRFESTDSLMLARQLPNKPWHSFWREAVAHD